MTSIRRLHADNRGALEVHLLALSREDRRLRFGGTASDATVRGYVARIDFEGDAVLGFPADGGPLAGAAHLAIVRGVGELGVSVLSPCRRKGIGSALFQQALEFARNRFVRTLFMRCLAENEAVMRIALRSGMKIVSFGSAAEARLELPPVDLRVTRPANVKPVTPRARVTGGGLVPTGPREPFAS